jgi:hypothetical protein
MVSTRRLAVTGLAGLWLSVAPNSQTANEQWLIERVEGGWEVRSGKNATREIGRYEVLTPSDQVRCVKPPCRLMYSTSSGELRVFPLPRANARTLPQWTRVPSPPAAERLPAYLSDEAAEIGVRGGRKKDHPACVGDLPLQAPGCRDVIGTHGLKLRWSAIPSEAGKSLSLVVGGTDSYERRRWNAIPADAGEFEHQSLNEYLGTLQLADRPTDVTIRLMRSERLSAVRMVHLISRADEDILRRKMQNLAALPDLARSLALVDEYLARDMVSSAAELALGLLRDAPDSLAIQKLALIGLCRSDFADEIARLRDTLGRAGVKGLCDPEGTRP